MAWAYYNEWDQGAADWLRELIKRGLIASGEVDQRSILDVTADDLRDFTQCHFFAGIGGWSYALRLAGWSDDQPVWTGSPPCQPFSSAGRQVGKDDERHLAPHFVSLVRTARPGVLFGEQVASAAVFGGAAKAGRGEAQAAPQWAWLDDLSDRLEAAHYAIGASDIPSASVGAPHIRQRTFFGAVRMADSDASSQGMVGVGHLGMDCWSEGDARSGHRSSSSDGGLADSDHQGPQGRRQPGCERSAQRSLGASGVVERMADSGFQQRQERISRPRQGDCTEGSGPSVEPSGLCSNSGWTSQTHSPWGTSDWLYCRDGKWRPVESGTFPLAHGVSARVGRLRGYGNAINPYAAKEFIKAFVDAMGDDTEELL